MARSFLCLLHFIRLQQNLSLVISHQTSLIQTLSQPIVIIALNTNDQYPDPSDVYFHNADRGFIRLLNHVKSTQKLLEMMTYWSGIMMLTVSLMTHVQQLQTLLFGDNPNSAISKVSTKW